MKLSSMLFSFALLSVVSAQAQQYVISTYAEMLKLVRTESATRTRSEVLGSRRTLILVEKRFLAFRFLGAA